MGVLFGREGRADGRYIPLPTEQRGSGASVCKGGKGLMGLTGPALSMG